MLRPSAPKSVPAGAPLRNFRRPGAAPVAKAAVQGANPVEREAAGPALAPFDWWLFVIMLCLLAIGLVMVLSSSGITAEQLKGDKYYFFKRQTLFAACGIVALWCAAVLPRDLLNKIQYPAVFGALLLVLITLSPLAPTINGAKRWISLGPISVQPMEFVKIALALYLAYFMSAKQDLVRTFSRGVIPPFAVTGLFCFLLLLQPDFGSAVLIAGILFFMCIAGGTRALYLVLSLALASCGIVALAITAPYRFRRFVAFIDPWADPGGAGYQLVQSLYAIGSGSFFGVGIGASRQKMHYLPEAHNDFIMAILAEETGFVGVSIVMGLYCLLFWRCHRIVMGQRNLRDRLTAFGITIIIAMGAVMNMAVVMGMIPPKGVPMPLLSYGGSSLMATMICIGLLMNYSRTVGPCTDSS
ncbi:MAG: putative lipid II flippase FtsW [Desulfovibrio sp.]|jgi:cell division protein FtsW|nr:putative lipid II flippase FtsW [Desulfovibrio sp.]